MLLTFLFIEYLSASFSNIFPTAMSVFVILVTLMITLSILNMNYQENRQRSLSRKQPILNHWGKDKPSEEDLNKLRLETEAFNKQGSR